MKVILLTHLHVASLVNELRNQHVNARKQQITIVFHNDIIKWKHFPRYLLFVRGIHRSLVNFPHNGQWCRALMFSLICAWIKCWVNNREAWDLRRYGDHYDATVMFLINTSPQLILCHMYIDVARNSALDKSWAKNIQHRLVVARSIAKHPETFLPVNVSAATANCQFMLHFLYLLSQEIATCSLRFIDATSAPGIPVAIKKRYPGHQINIVFDDWRKPNKGCVNTLKIDETLTLIAYCTGIFVRNCFSLSLNFIAWVPMHRIEDKSLLVWLTHWGRVTYICVGKLTLIGSNNGLSPGLRQGIIWTNAEILLIGFLGTNFNDIQSQFIYFHSGKSISKCRLENGGQFVWASLC